MFLYNNKIFKAPRFKSSYTFLKCPLLSQSPSTGNLAIIGSDNGLSSGWCQAIIWTNAGILLIGPLGTNFGEILIKSSYIFIHTNERSSGKWQSFVSASMWKGTTDHHPGTENHWSSPLVPHPHRPGIHWAPHPCFHPRSKIVKGEISSLSLHVSESTSNLTVSSTEKIASNICFTYSVWGESTMTYGFPAQRASNAESISMSWSHDEATCPTVHHPQCRIVTL